jgi:serine phosphatase RsbU (regulator of sigma subunit)
MSKTWFRWLWRRQKNWIHLQYVPVRQLSVFMAAIFLLFSVGGFYTDLMEGGVLPAGVVLILATYTGLNSVLWFLVVTRMPIFCILLMIAKEIFLPLGYHVEVWAKTTLHQSPMAPQAGIPFAATAILTVVICSYILFSSYLGTTGREAFRLKNELALAHSIQKTLVPPVSRSTASFEIYGISQPSEKVGGDLVDIVELPGGDTVAYLADIAGHGLQAGILMGMLKTAARTALTDGGRTNDGDGENGLVLSQLMYRLNVVLPQVKEANMYATFTSLRLNEDRQSFYGMAASPPLLHWNSAQKSIVRIEEQQFPLGLLPVAEFPAHRLTMETGDLVVIATDGILEVNSSERTKQGAEFGVEALEKLVTGHASLPLPELAALILKTVRSYGKQLDDQTLLLVRRRVR